MQTRITMTLRGRLGRDPEYRITPTGQAVTSFNVACEQGYGDNKTTLWVRCSVWNRGETGKAADNAMEYLSAGDLVEVGAARIRATAWEDERGGIHGQLEVTAAYVDYLITKKRPEVDGTRTDGGSEPEEEGAPGDALPF